MILALSNHTVLELYAVLTFMYATLSVFSAFYEDSRSFESMSNTAWILTDIGLAIYLGNIPLLMAVLVANALIQILYMTIQLERHYRAYDYEQSRCLWYILSATKATTLAILFYLAAVHQEKLKLCPETEGVLFLLPTA